MSRRRPWETAVWVVGIVGLLLWLSAVSVMLIEWLSTRGMG